MTARRSDWLTLGVTLSQWRSPLSVRASDDSLFNAKVFTKHDRGKYMPASWQYLGLPGKPWWRSSRFRKHLGFGGTYGNS